MALDRNVQGFMVYISSLVTKIIIYSAKKAQILL